MFFKIGVPKNFAILTGKQAWKPATLLKRDSNTGVFLWILQNFVRTTFFIEHLR